MEQLSETRALIEAARQRPDWKTDPSVRAAVERTMDWLDLGRVRVATPPPPGEDDWTVHSWVQAAVSMYFGVTEMREMRAGVFRWFDRIPLRDDLPEAGVRAVPPAAVRHGAFVEPGAILMPSYVNIGAWVGAGTMVDTWATVGSCAQIGRGVHLSGGVGIGGVLEPPGARPVIIEDGAFLGSRAIVVEGVKVGAEAVVAANVSLTASTPIIDVTGPAERVIKGAVPPRAVVVPGTRTKTFPAGDYQLACALIIGHRKESTDRKTSLNDALREHGVQV